MQIDLKRKRQSAGFIRTSSSKALPSFKIDSQNNSSDDFSSFENEKKVQDSSASFSPYKHPSQYLSKPPKQTFKQSHKETQPVFQNDRLKNSYMEEEKKRKSGTISSERHKDILKRRTEVENELAQIDKICSEIGQLEGPHSFKDRYERMMGNKSATGFIQDEDQKQKGLQYFERKQKRQKDDLSYEQNNGKHVIKNESTKTNQNTNLSNRPKTCSYTSLNHNQQISNNSKYQFQETSNISEDSEQDIYDSQFDIKRKSNQQQKITNASQFDDFGSFGTKKSQSIQNKLQSNYQPQNKNRPYQQDLIKKQHQKARTRFISQKQQTSSEGEQPQEDDQMEGFEENDEALIQDYGKEEFKRNLKECVEEKNKSSNNQTGLYKTKGGICFDLDVNEFTQKQTLPQTKTNYASLPKKPKKVNTKEQLLKRRQMAKNYDRQARVRVFGAY